MKLYRYYSPKKGLNAITTNRIYFTPPKFFNDPFEFLPSAKRPLNDKEIAAKLKTRRHQDVIRRAFKSIGIFEGNKNEFKKWLYDNFDEALSILKSRFRNAYSVVQNTFCDMISNHYAVCSLSLTFSNILMWSHYADSHRGIIIGYDLQESDFPNGSLSPVNYKVERVLVEPLFFAGTEPYKKDLLESMQTKSVSWKYEQEYRIILPINKCLSEVIEDRKYFYQELSKNKTKCVILGAKANEDLYKKVKLASIQYPSVKLEKALLSTKYFKIEIASI